MAQLLAKPDIPLIEHLRNVVKLGREIAVRLELDERLLTKALIACGLHDIGKATVDFQEYIRGRRGRAYPHALASMPVILMIEQMLNWQMGWGEHDLTATASVLTHHSPLGPELYKGFETPQWHPDWRRVLEEVQEFLRAEVRYLPDVNDPLVQDALQVLLSESPAGLLYEGLSFPDGRRASLHGIFQSLPPREFSQVKTVLHLADWLASAGKADPRVLFLDIPLSAFRAQLQKEIAKKRPEAQWRDFQRKAMEVRTEVLWLRAPTGTGKTEALLLWAGETERLIYLLPTQATTNAMWRRLRGIYGHDQVGLAHGRASYMLRKESDEDPLDARLLGSVFAKPVTVATLDQFLLAHLHGRHWEERRALAQRATVVLDEIHAYEPYTLGLLLEALDRERPARLALASATLPPGLLDLFPKGTLVEAEPSLWGRRRHRLEWHEGSLFDALPEAVQWAREGRSILIVANTVQDAQELYKRLRDEHAWEPRYLLHARFTFSDRQEKEALVEKPSPGTIFIATQVVEVSLDISYDVLLTEVAPVDALVQRMGRVNRRGEKPPAPVVICRRWSEGAQHVYGKEILTWSLEILSELPPEPTDADLAEAANRLYKRVMATENWWRELSEGRQTLDELQRILGCYTIDLSDEEMRQRFTTRRGVVSVEVLPNRFREEAYRLIEQGEGWRIIEFLVPVPLPWLRRYWEFFEPRRDLRCLETSLPYNSELGLLPPTGELVEETYVIV